MKDLTLGEFREICNKLNPKEYILHSDNQSFQFSELGLKFDFRFNAIDFCLNPDIIYLMFGNTRLQINKINRIYKCKSSVFRNMFNIVCTGFYNDNMETTHTLLLR